jgi:hypothetical protein
MLEKSGHTGDIMGQSRRMQQMRGLFSDQSKSMGDGDNELIKQVM